MERCPTCHRKYRRSIPANSLYWRLLTLMAERSWHGQTFSAEAFHEYYARKFLGAEDVTLPGGKVISVRKSTADLDAAEFAEYFDRVQADAQERGVWLEDCDE